MALARAAGTPTALAATHHPVLAVVMFSAEFVPGAVLLLTMLYGSKERCERVFRFLRWTKDRPEPAQNADVLVEPAE